MHTLPEVGDVHPPPRVWPPRPRDKHEERKRPPQTPEPEHPPKDDQDPDGGKHINEYARNEARL